MTDIKDILVLSGDGIGPEVVPVACAVMQQAVAAHGVEIDRPLEQASQK